MNKTKGILFALISSGTFGLLPFFTIPITTEEFGEGSLLFYRFLFSSIFMALVCLFRKEKLAITKKELPVISGLGLFYAMTALFLIYSYGYIASGISTSIHFVYPIMVSVLMMFFFKEKKSFSVLFAGCLSLLGVSLMCMSGTNTQSDDGGMFFGLVLAALSFVTYALYIVGVNQFKVIKALSSEVLTFYILFAGAIFFFFFALFTEGLSLIPDLKTLVNLIMLAILCTVISDFTLILAIKSIGSTATSILGSMEPIVAIAVGVLFFSESFSFNSLIGCLLIIAGVTFVILKTAGKEDEEELSPAYSLKEEEREER